MSVMIYKVSSIINKKSTELQKQQSELTTIVHETFSGIRIIKSHNKEKQTQLKFNTATEAYKKLSLSLTLTNAIFMPTIYITDWYLAQF